MNVKQLAAKIESQHEALKTYMAGIDATSGGNWTTEQKAEVQRRLGELKATKAELDRTHDAAQKAEAEEAVNRLLEGLALPGSNAAPWGDAVIKASSGPGGFKALIPAGATTVAVPAPAVVELGRPVRSLLQLIPREPTAGVFGYLRQTCRTNNAAPVAVGALKPTSVYTTELVEDRARTIAHLSEAIPRQYLADAAMLRQWVESEMRYGLELALEAQVLNGDGVGENLLGILNTPGTQAQAWDTNLLVTTRKAVTKLETVDLTGTGWALNPADWERIELSTDADGQFLVGGPNAGPPVERASRRLWGIPVATSTAVPAGTGVLADFEGSTRLWVREEAEVSWSESVGDDFSHNLLRMRAEGRVGFGVLRPIGAVEVDLTAA